MKKAFKMAALAVAVLGLTVACKQKAAEPIDTIPTEDLTIEAAIDTMPLDTIVEEAASAVATTAKKTTKKAEPKKEEKKNDITNVGRNANPGTVTPGTVKTDLDPANAQPKKNTTPQLGNVGRNSK